MTNYKFLPKEKGTRCFLMTLLNAITMLLTSCAVYFASFFPIREVQFKEKEIQMNAYRDELLSMADESKLVHKDDKGSYYTVYESYSYYTQVLLKHNYENGGYDLEKDPENYKLKQEALSKLHGISVDETKVNDNYFGEFYTSYILNKKDVNGDLIIDFKSQNPKDYFYYEILDLDGKGKEFFKETTGEFPLFKDEVRKNLFDYILLKTMTNEAYETDNKFFSYFVEINNKSGDFLIKYNDYASKLEQHDKIYFEIENYNKTAIFVCSLIGFVTPFIIFPLFNKYKRNPAEVVLSRVYLKETNEGPQFKISSFIIRTLYSVIKYFFVVFIFAIIVDINVSFGTILYLGTFPISLFSITTILLMVSAVSLCISMMRPDRKNLENLISGTRVYSFERDLTSTEE